MDESTVNNNAPATENPAETEIPAESDVNGNDTTAVDDNTTDISADSITDADIENDDDNQETGKSKRQSLIAEFYDYFEIFVFSACAVLILFSFFTRLCRVDGDSMLDTLHNDEMLIVTNLFYTPERGDIIVFHQTGSSNDYLNKPIVKRVIATGGEWVDIELSDSKLLVTIYDENMENPVVLEEDYARYTSTARLITEFDYPLFVPEGTVFVLGDNRNNSTDSRFEKIGLVDTRRVLGKVICRVTPLDSFGAVS